MSPIEHKGEGKGKRIRLVDAINGSSATIAPNRGFNCYSFEVRSPRGTFDFLYAGEEFPADGKVTHHGTPILAPFPNRIRGGRFSHEGKEYSLKKNDRDKNAIHGLAVDDAWRVTGEGESTESGIWVRGEFQLSKDRPDAISLWPGDFLLSITYSLRGARLTTQIEVTNPNATPLPFGFGTHPYFRFPLTAETPLGECEVFCPAVRIVELDEYLPTGKWRVVNRGDDLRSGMSLDKRTFDDVYGQLTRSRNGDIEHILRDRTAGVDLRIRHDPDFLFAVVYTPPDRRSICIEPYTCVTDAINLTRSDFDGGLWKLPAGQKRTLRIEYEAVDLPRTLDG